jgi:hypothetical protein
MMKTCKTYLIADRTSTLCFYLQDDIRYIAEAAEKLRPKAARRGSGGGPGKGELLLSSLIEELTSSPTVDSYIFSSSCLSPPL